MLFAVSGFLKWLPLPIDPTIAFGVLSLLGLVFNFFSFNFSSFNRFEKPVILFLVFHILYFLTSFYTLSESFFVDKMIRVVFNLIIFFSPVFLLRDAADFKFLKKVLIIAFSITIFLLGYNWIDNRLLIFIFTDLNENTKIPNYLNISYLLGAFILFMYDRNSIFFIILKVLALLFIITLASRGVILFLGIIYFFEFLKTLIYKRKNLKYIFLGAVAFLVYMISTGGAIFQHLEKRLFVGSDFQKDASSQARIELFDKATEAYANNPFFGIGIGGFGRYAENLDARLSPHNILLEILMETGFVGFMVLILVFVFFISEFRKVNKIASLDKERLSYLYPLIFILMGDMVSGIFEDSRLNYFCFGLAVSYYMFITNKSKTHVRNIGHN